MTLAIVQLLQRIFTACQRSLMNCEILCPVVGGGGGAQPCSRVWHPNRPRLVGLALQYRRPHPVRQRFYGEFGVTGLRERESLSHWVAGDSG